MSPLLKKSADQRLLFFSWRIGHTQASSIPIDLQTPCAAAAEEQAGGAVGWTTVTEDVKGLEFIKRLRPVTYTVDISSHRGSGFIAQEVEKAANETGFSFGGIDKPANDKALYGLRYSEFVVPLVKAVQEQQQLIENQQQKIDALEKRLAALEKGLNRQEVGN